MKNHHSISLRLAEIIVRFRWLLLVLALIMTAVLVNFAKGLQFDGSVDVWFADNDPAELRRNEFRETFGNQHSVLILLEPEQGADLLSVEKAATIYEMVQQLELSTPFLKQALWIGSVEIVEPEGEGIRISRLFEHAPPFTAAETEQARTRAMEEPEFINRYISPDGRSLAILLDLYEYPEGVKSPEMQVAQAVGSVVKGVDLSGIRISVVGEPVFMQGYTALAGQQTPMLFGMCLAVQLVLLALLTRTVASTFTPLFIVLLSVAWTFGIIGLAGYDLNLMVIGLPIILVCVCIGDAVHLITAFSTLYRAGVARKEAMVQAVAETVWPCLLTSLTTASGFFSFIAAPMRPFQQMALYVPCGIMAAFVLTFIMVPCFYAFGRNVCPRPAGDVVSRKHRQRTDVFFNGIASIVIKRPRSVVSVFAVLCMVAAFAATQVRIESNNNKLLTEAVPLRKAIDRVDAAMGGSMAVDVLLDTAQADGVKNVQFLREMEKLESYIARHPLVVNTTCVLEPLRKTRGAVYKGDPDMRVLPDTDQAAAEYLFLYEMAGGNQLDRLVSFDSSKARINVRTTSLGTEDGRRLSEDIRTAAMRIMSPDVRVSMSGSIDLTVALTDNVARGQNASFALAMLSICMVMMVAARSFRMGLISMVPNVVPVLMVLGLLGVTGIYMDTVLMSVSAMILGVATDDTIHFFIRLRREFKHSGRYNEALRAALVGVGRPLLFTTITLSLGFAVLSSSVMVGWIKIGLLSGYAFFWALAADLTLFPALFLLIRPFGEEKAIQEHGEDK